MARVYISSNDPVHYYIYDEQECTDMFGDDMLSDYGVEIPDELLARYKDAYKTFWAIQDEIAALNKTKG